MVPTQELEWLAGLVDGEGCIRVHRVKRTGVASEVVVGMTHEPSVRRVASLIERIAGEGAVAVYRRSPIRLQKQALWCAKVTSKEGVRSILRMLEPRLRSKRLEARLVLDYVERAAAVRRYVAQDEDRLLCELSSGLKRCDPDAYNRAVGRVGSLRAERTLTAPWLAGFFDGEGTVRLVRQRGRAAIWPYVCLSNTDVSVLTAARDTLAAEIGDVLSFHEQKTNLGSRKCLMFFSSKKTHCDVWLRLMRPFLVTKALEADLVLLYLSRASTQGRTQGRDGVFVGYAPTEVDYRIHALLRRLKKGDEDARAETMDLVG